MHRYSTPSFLAQEDQIPLAGEQAYFGHYALQIRPQLRPSSQADPHEENGPQREKLGVGIYLRYIRYHVHTNNSSYFNLTLHMSNHQLFI